jgi:hypothetical protein
MEAVSEVQKLTEQPHEATVQSSTRLGWLVVWSHLRLSHTSYILLRLWAVHSSAH